MAGWIQWDRFDEEAAREGGAVSQMRREFSVEHPDSRADARRGFEGGSSGARKRAGLTQAAWSATGKRGGGSNSNSGDSAMDKGALTKFVEAMVASVQKHLELTEGEVKTARSLVGLQLKMRGDEIVKAAITAGGGKVAEEVAG